MSLKIRFLIALAMMLGIGGVVLGLEFWRGQSGLPAARSGHPDARQRADLPGWRAGGGAYTPDALEALETGQPSRTPRKASRRTGWLLRDVLAGRTCRRQRLGSAETTITVISSKW